MYNQTEQAILLMCMVLKGDKDSEYKPLSTSEWSKVAERLQLLQLTPEFFLKATPDDLRLFTENNQIEMNRYIYLLRRGSSLSYELKTINELGIGALTRASIDYPKILKEKLLRNSPPILFYAGDLQILHHIGYAIIGSREINDNDNLVATKLSEKLARAGHAVISGGAKGVDTSAEIAALEAGGYVLSVISDSLVARIKNKVTREFISAGKLLLISPYGFDSHFTVGNAMGRNKFIYAFSKASFVIKSSFRTGGTWAGVEEAVKKNLSSIYVLEQEGSESGNSDLAQEHGLPVIRKRDVLDAMLSIDKLIANGESNDKHQKTSNQKVLKDDKSKDFEIQMLDLDADK